MPAEHIMIRTAALLACIAMPTANGAAQRRENMPARLVSSIDVRNFGAEYIRIGDLNQDGSPDLLFCQSDYPTRKITCLTATTLAGEALWQMGAPSIDNGRIYSDLPVQIYDWDGDSRNEVLYVRQARYVEPIYLAGTKITEHARRYDGDATMVILDGRTGKEKDTFALPAPADDCFLFADLTGRGRREDLVVKDRYWNMWGISHEGKVLWHWEGSPGHFPAIGDMDNDGRDEVWVGLALLDHDGKVLFERRAAEHQDAVYVVQLKDASWRLLEVTDAIRCWDVSGKELWAHRLIHPQHVVVGHFRADSERQVAVIDRGTPQPNGSIAPATLYLYDLQGKEIWRRVQPPGSHYAGIVLIDWFGPGALQGILCYGRGNRDGQREKAAVYDGNGERADELTMVYPPAHAAAGEKTDFYGTRANVFGDARDEVILFNSYGCCVYANVRAFNPPNLYNHNLYPGM
jgi:hypothetical protein